MKNLEFLIQLQLILNKLDHSPMLVIKLSQKPLNLLIISKIINKKIRRKFLILMNKVQNDIFLYNSYILDSIYKNIVN